MINFARNFRFKRYPNQLLFKSNETKKEESNKNYIPIKSMDLDIKIKKEKEDKKGPNMLEMDPSNYHFKDLCKITKDITENLSKIDQSLKKLNELDTIKKMKKDQQYQFNSIWNRYYDLLEMVHISCNKALIICSNGNTIVSQQEYKQPFIELQTPMIKLMTDIRKFLRELNFYEHEPAESIEDLKMGFKNVFISFSAVFFAISFISYFHENYSFSSVPQSMSQVLSMFLGFFLPTEKDLKEYNENVEKTNKDLHGFIPKVKYFVRELQISVIKLQELNNSVVEVKHTSNKVVFFAEFRDNVRFLRKKVMKYLEN